MIHQGTVQLETERLVLRRFTEEDAPSMLANWANDPDVTEFLTWAPHGSIDVTRTVLAEWVAAYERPDWYQWAIELRDTGELVGSISVVSLNEETGAVEVGYCIGRPWWRRGITTEALNAVMGFLFERVGARRVWAKHDTRNPNSGRVMALCGMSYEGTIRQSGVCNQGVGDLTVRGMLRDEWKRDGVHR